MANRSEPQKKSSTDEEIIDLYWQRNETAIRETDRKYGAYLFRIAYQILNDRLDSDECQNDTYFEAWNTIPPTRPRVLPAFLTRIMRFIAIDRYREKKSKKRVPSELTLSMEELGVLWEARTSEENEWEAKALGNILSEFIRSLPKRRRYIFIGRYYAAEAVETLAMELSVSVPTVYRELEKIKKDLKEHLERSGVKV